MFRVSILDDGGAGIEGDGDSRRPSISADGVFVAFEIGATNFSDFDFNEGQSDVYVRQILDGSTMELISKTPADTPEAPAGTSSIGRARTPLGPSSISADGRFVAFGSVGSDFVGGDANEHATRSSAIGSGARRSASSVTDDEAEANDDERYGRREQRHDARSAGRSTAAPRSSRARPISWAATSGEQAGLRPRRGTAQRGRATSSKPITRLRARSRRRCTFDQPDTSRTVDIYWLNFAGERERYGTLEPGGSYDQPTWITHPWVAVDHVTGAATDDARRTTRARRSRSPRAMAAAARASSRSRPSSPTTKP